MVYIAIQEQAKLKAHRDGRSINRNVIAVETGISYSTILKYWDNDVKAIDVRVAETLCGYFECSITDLITDSLPEETEAPEEWPGGRACVETATAYDFVNIV